MSRFLAFVALALVVAAPGIALAHAVPVATTPDANAAVSESPREVTIRFSERVEARASSLEILDARGKPVGSGMPHVDPGDPWLYRLAVPALEPGAYTVSWRVLSADDGHVTEGAHGFAIGAAGTAPPVPTAAGGASPAVAALGRWLAMLGALVLLGALAGPLIFGATGQPAPAWLLVASLAAMAGGELIAFGARAAQLAAGPGLPAATAALLTTAVGRVTALKLALTAVVAALLAVDARRAPRRDVARAPVLLIVLLGVLLGGLVTHSAAAVSWRGLALGAEGLHLLGAAVWLAGLAYFATLFWRTFQAAVPALPRAIPVFSLVATVAVGSLSLSGLYLARLHLDSLGALVGTPYGQLLLAKLAAAAAMLGLGAYHQLRVHPRAVAALAQPADRAEAVARRFRRTLRIEAGLGAVVLLLAAFLGSTPPTPDMAPAAAFRHGREVDGVRLVLEISPLRSGRNTIRVTATDPHGRPLADARAALVQLVPPHDHVGPVALTLAPTAPGSFATPDALLGMEGAWKGRVVVQREGAYDLNERFEVVVPGAATPAAAGRPAPLDVPMGIAAAAILALTLCLVLRNRRALARAPLLADTLDPCSGRRAGQEVS